MTASKYCGNCCFWFFHLFFRGWLAWLLEIMPAVQVLGGLSIRVHSKFEFLLWHWNLSKLLLILMASMIMLVTYTLIILLSVLVRNFSKNLYQTYCTFQNFWILTVYCTVSIKWPGLKNFGSYFILLALNTYTLKVSLINQAKFPSGFHKI